MCNRRRAAGMSLIEVVVFIIVLAVGFTGILMLYNRATSASVDPLVRKQALAIAASLLEEIELRGFTYCDPDDANVYTAANSGACTTPEAIGPEGGETRYAEPRFDNVSDYDGFTMAGANIKNIDGTTISGLTDYSVSVTVAQIAANELGASVPASEGLRITVTATHVPTGTTVSLQGYRLRYAPNTP
jgi:MSHA pilin protein MshD